MQDVPFLATELDDVSPGIPSSAVESDSSEERQDFKLTGFAQTLAGLLESFIGDFAMHTKLFLQRSGLKISVVTSS
jgi:hypothetical protein